MEFKKIEKLNEELSSEEQNLLENLLEELGKVSEFQSEVKLENNELKVLKKTQSFQKSGFLLTDFNLGNSAFKKGSLPPLIINEKYSDKSDSENISHISMKSDSENSEKNKKIESSQNLNLDLNQEKMDLLPIKNLKVALIKKLTHQECLNIFSNLKTINLKMENKLIQKKNASCLLLKKTNL